MTQKKCIQCGSPIDRSVKSFPFCSERCKLLDLGAWADENYRVPSAQQSSEEVEMGAEMDEELDSFTNKKVPLSE